MKKLILISTVLLLIGFFECEAQSQKTLTQKEIDAINLLFDKGIIGVESDGWTINPDIWNISTFIERKGFTERLSIYYKNYLNADKETYGYCYFYNMATKKKIARWYNNEYKEY